MNKLAKKFNGKNSISIPAGVVKSLGFVAGDLLFMKPVSGGIRLEKIKFSFDALAENGLAQHRKKKATSLFDVAKRRKIPLETGQTVRLTRSVQRDLGKSGNAVKTIVLALARLGVVPKEGTPMKESEKGVFDLALNLPGVGMFRAAYVILSDKKTCLVFLIGVHASFQRKAEKRILAIYSSRQPAKK